MDSPVVIPLGIFFMVVIIVAIVHLLKIRERELAVHQKLHQEEMDHQGKMRELESELERVRRGG